MMSRRQARRYRRRMRRAMRRAFTITDEDYSIDYPGGRMIVIHPKKAGHDGRETSA